MHFSMSDKPQFLFSGNLFASWVYDGDGRRVKAFEAWVNPQTTWYWNDKSGNVLAETDQFLDIHNIYFYLNGERIAYGPQDGGGSIVYFYYRDHLGNVRAITDKWLLEWCYPSDRGPFQRYLSAVIGGKRFVRGLETLPLAQARRSARGNAAPS
jgi:hypothetical protein